MSEFDEWNKYNLGYTGQQAFEAGQQSQQAKIDELSRKVESNLEINKNLQNMLDELIDERDELQKRIEKALLKLTENKTMYVDIVAETIDILKGNKDEN